MNDTKPAIRENMVVTLDYTLTLDNGEVMEITHRTVCVRFYNLSSGELLPAFEGALTGMTTRLKLVPDLVPEDGYGEYDEEAFEEVSIENFPSREASNRAWLLGCDSDGETYPAYISEKFHEDTVISITTTRWQAKTLHFHVTVLDVRATRGRTGTATRTAATYAH